MNNSANQLVRDDCETVLSDRTPMLEALRGATLVVTGGTGFMGTWLAEMVACLNDEYSFQISLLLVSRSADQFGVKCPHLAQRTDTLLQKSDVRHLMELPKETNFLIHAAGNPDSRFHASNPIETMNVIADGPLAVLRAIERCSDFRQLLNVSSGLVYGPQPIDLERVSESESGAPLCSSASSAYAEAKRYAETLCSAARTQARIPVVTARPFAFIGPYQSLETPWAINSFMHDALTSNPIRVFGDGRTIRSYMYPSDMAYWLLRQVAAGTSGFAYNVGSPTGTSLENVAGLISTHFTPRPEIRLRTESNAGTPSRLVPDVALAASDLGLVPTIPLEVAIERTIAWHLANREPEHAR